MKKRMLRFQILCLMFAVALSVRLADLQLLRREEFIRAAEENRIRIRGVRALRGKIFDRSGVVLASNSLSHDLIFVAAKAPKGTLEITAARLGAILEEDTGPLIEKMESARRLPLWPIVLARDIPVPTLEKIVWYSPFLPGIEVQVGPVRTYPENGIAAHALGYLGEISVSELSKLREEGYKLGDWIGKSGVERRFDIALRGIDGLEQFEADPLGQPLRLLGEKPFTPGDDLTLTIDADLSRWANEALAGKEGAVVAIEPSSGRVLCLVSTPGYDPAIFVDRNLMDSRVAVLRDTGHPLLSRAWNATYPPASTFKMVGMLAGLRSGKITPNTRYSCGGSYMGKGCWKRSGHGSLDLLGGFANSCDVYFYHLAQVVGIEDLAATARALGINQKGGLELGTERSGQMPTPEWEHTYVRGPDGEFWGLGDLLNTVIGQGYVDATAIQVARMTASTIMGGRRMKLGIVEKIRNAEVENFKFEPVIENDLELGPAELRTIRKAFLAVVERGTAARYQIPGFRFGGKTGTAQNPHGEDHGWFTAVAPLSEADGEAPRIVVTALLVHGEHGTAAAKIVRYILERWGVREGYLAGLESDTKVVAAAE